MYYVTMQITFFTRKFRNGERNLHCDVVHITTKWVSSLTLDCNGVFAIKAYRGPKLFTTSSPKDKRHNNVHFFRQRSLERTMDCVDTD